MSIDKHCAKPPILVDARFRQDPRGGDRCRYELAVHLSRCSSVRYAFLAYPETRHLLMLDPETRLLACPSTPDQHPACDIFEHLTLPRLARGISVDLYHGTYQVLPLLSPARITVVTIHDMALFAFPQAYGKRFVPYMQFLMRKSIQKATSIIAITDATKQEIIRYFPDAAAKIVTILNGVGQEFVDARNLSQEAVQAVTQQFDLGAPYILFVGNLEPKKNLARLIEAFLSLRREQKIQHTLLIVGKPLEHGPGAAADMSPETLQEQGVRFTGYVDDKILPALYRGASLVAYPSLYEGFGMPVLEGMAAGVPVLTSTVSSLPEVAGGAAMLVDPTHTDTIAQGLYRALTDQSWRRAAIDAGVVRAAGLPWEKNAQATAELYQNLLEKSGAKS